jgi:predicted dehydrogenase
MAAKVEGAEAFADYRDMFDKVDAVILAVPHDLHFEMGKSCLEAGKHLLLEKPLALTKAECEELVAADKSPDPVLMVGYIMRHDPLWTEMGRLIKEEVYGKAFQVSIWTEQYTDTSRGAWIGQADKLGGGQLFSHGCHYVDLMLDWMGKPESGTHIGTNLGTPWMEREGTSNMSIKFADTWGARGSRHGYAVHAHCTEGMLELNHKGRTISLHRDKSGGDLPALEAAKEDKAAEVSPTETIIYRDESAGKPAYEQLIAFIDCIENKKKPEISAAASMPSLNTIWALYEAEEKGIVADLSRI